MVRCWGVRILRVNMVRGHQVKIFSKSSTKICCGNSLVVHKWGASNKYPCFCGEVRKTIYKINKKKTLSGAMPSTIIENMYNTMRKFVQCIGYFSNRKDTYQSVHLQALIQQKRHLSVSASASLDQTVQTLCKCHKPSSQTGTQLLPETKVLCIEVV